MANKQNRHQIGDTAEGPQKPLPKRLYAVAKVHRWSALESGAGITIKIDTPDSNYNGADTFTYSVADPSGASSAATVTLAVTPVNDAPTAAPDSATTPEDTTVSVAVLANDTDPDGDTLSLVSFTQAAHGAVTEEVPGELRYTSAPDYSGSDTFSYTVRDSSGLTGTAAVTITVTPVNDPPVAVDDSAGTLEDVVVTIQVVANDSDVDGDTLSVIAVSPGTHGSAVPLAGGSILYTPFANEHGTDNLTYTISDPSGATTSAAVTIVITPVNDPPTAAADSGTTPEEGSVSIAVLANDIDIDGDPITLVSFTQPLHGTVDLPSPGLLRYTPATNYFGSDSFTYQVSDPLEASAWGTVTVQVTPVPDPPVVSLAADRISGTTPLLVQFTATASDPDQDTLTYSWDFGDGETASGGMTRDHTYNSGGTFQARVTVSDGQFQAEAFLDIAVTQSLPPDPATVAPPLDRTVTTSLFAASEFLYTGANPIQAGVAPGTIQARTVAVLRGKVLDRQDQPLSGVEITIHSHPELGRTLSRADGLFDIAVNGGGLLTVQYNKTGYLEVHRQITAPWRDYAWLPDVVLIPFDTQVTSVELTPASPLQVAAGSLVTDEDGTRRAVVMFPAGTTAGMTLEDGTIQPVTAAHVRATEFTIGPNGDKAMPAALPPSIAYIYCVDFSLDEAVTAGATEVDFSQPVFQYIENFLNFPVGEAVPSGYYDPARALWVPSDNGLVIQVLSVTGGKADIDVSGSGSPADGPALAALASRMRNERNLLSSTRSAKACGGCR